MKRPERIELDLKQVDALLERAKKVLSPEDYEIIKAMADTIYLLSRSVNRKSASIKRLLRTLFGTTEKLEQAARRKEKKSSRPQKGHGRKAASDYAAAQRVTVEHGSLKPGDNCPKCDKGKVYEMQEPKKIVRITGNAPLSGTVYEMQRLRCNLCGVIFTADTPEGIGEEKYDARSKAVIAVLKYGSGMPLNRLENLQKNLGIPLPASTQFEILKESADTLEPVFSAMIEEAAQGEVLYNDDTTMRVLELMKEKEAPRKGVFTTGILSTTGEHQITLFFTGRKHAGENLQEVLSQRRDRSPPIQMCDALARNIPKDFETLLCNCLAHGRRQFVDVLQSFPEGCRHVLEVLAEVYKNEEEAKRGRMDPEQRLQFHQVRSGPLMEELHEWLNRQLNDHLVEPNSGLGQAMKYMLRHWEPLTAFLRVPGAPLDNNICERALKTAIRHRKNALFYKTMNGARVGDLFMSLIHTCSLNGVNPVEYLTAVLEHAAQMSREPEKWLPWNYTAALPAH